ncbi:hypothetical protein AB0945_43110 [Streptomyces sp. NPDC005474]|uniref:hypothetical protein n=1 Tax=Streptomyces sp. NPDC005474 TaxID=3154878 RepID=UPI003455168B
MSRGLGRVQRAVLAYVGSEPGGRSTIDGAPLAASVTGLARVAYGVDQPTSRIGDPGYIPRPVAAGPW